MKFIAVVFAAIILSGCTLFGLGGESPQATWDKQTAVYNVVAERLVEAREPCVLIGPSAPGCLLDDAAYAKARVIQTTADGYLKAAELQIASGDSTQARFYLSSAAGALLALSDQLGMKPK